MLRAWIPLSGSASSMCSGTVCAGTTVRYQVPPPGSSLMSPGAFGDDGTIGARGKLPPAPAPHAFPHGVTEVFAPLRGGLQLRSLLGGKIASDISPAHTWRGA